MDSGSTVSGSKVSVLEGVPQKRVLGLVFHLSGFRVSGIGVGAYKFRSTSISTYILDIGLRRLCGGFMKLDHGCYGLKWA